jgi:dTDP-4-dehydrorhamnose reductase
VKILLIGSNGQVGNELTRLLPVLGDVVLAAVEGNGDLVIDFESRDSIVGAVRDVKPDLVVNAAAYTAVDKAEDEPELARLINAEAVGVLADACRIGNAALVHYSTDYVFDGLGNTPYREDDSTNPANVYGATKLAGETAIRDSGVSHLILRTSWVYSTHGHNFLLTMLRFGQEKDELDIVDDQHGTPTWANTIAQATVHALSRLSGEEAPAQALEKIGGTYHVTADGHTTWFGFATFLLGYATQLRLMPHMPELSPVTTAEFPTKAKRPAWSVLDNSRFCEQFGWTPPSWQTAVRHCLDRLVEEMQ